MIGNSWIRIFLSMLLSALAGSGFTIFGFYVTDLINIGPKYSLVQPENALFYFILFFVVWLCGILSLGTVMVLILNYFQKKKWWHWTIVGALAPGGFWFLPGLMSLIGLAEESYCMETAPSILVCWIVLLKQSAFIAVIGCSIGYLMWLLVHFNPTNHSATS